MIRSELTNRSELTTSAEVDKIYPALIKAIHSMPVVGKNAPNQSWLFANLQAVTEASRDPLRDNGLAITCFAANHDMHYGVIARLIHESGQWMECPVYLPSKNRGNADQGAGSSFTYTRRYVMCCILNIVTGEDNDANSRQQEIKRLQQEEVVSKLEEKKFRASCRDLLHHLKPSGITWATIAEKHGFALRPDEIPTHQREEVLAALRSA